MSKIRVAIGGDHAGYAYKEKLVPVLEKYGYEVKDYGPESDASCDYADFVHPLSAAIENGDHDFGVLICGSGNGVSITANKHQQIRSALCWNLEIAKLARGHNDANVISIPARFVSLAEAQEMILAFLQTEFEGGRHARRVGKIPC